MAQWSLANSRTLDLRAPAIMAILNCTPDSFYEASRLLDVPAAVEAARVAFHEGASIIDIGGESTRPGSIAVGAAEQIRRTVPVIGAIRACRDLDALAISIDTTRAAVAHAALDAGADAINDVSGLTDDSDAMTELLRCGCAGYVLMHRLKQPANDSYSDRYAAAPVYRDVVLDVKSHLQQMLATLASRGVEPSRVLLDPGLGFGKAVEQNLSLIRRTGEIAELGRPVLSGLSRKSFVGRLSLGRDSEPRERLDGTIALTVLHLLSGARLFRVHDVTACASALRASSAFLPVNLPPPSGIQEGENKPRPGSPRQGGGV